MSCIIVLAPVVIGGWPVITAAVTAAVASMGFSIVSQGNADQRRYEKGKGQNRVDIELEDSEILQDSVSGEKIVVEREGITAIFTRDARGALNLCIEGDRYSKSELKKIGQELIDRVTQQYVYHRVVTELKQRHMLIVDEHVAEDRTVKIKVRNI
jgi:hypothetical protein